MRKTMLAALLLLGSVCSANATVVTFDDITTRAAAVVPTEYAGLTWWNYSVLNAKSYPLKSGYKNAGAFGDYVAYSLLANSVTSDKDFNFVGAYLTSAWNNNLVVNVAGYNNGVSVYSRDVTLSPTSKLWFEADFLGIDELEMEVIQEGSRNPQMCGRGAFLAIDDFTYTETRRLLLTRNTPTPGTLALPVPEPSACLLMGAGAGVLALLRRKRRA